MKTILITIVLYSIVITHAIADEATKVVFHINEPEKMPLLVNKVKHFHENHKELQIYVVVNGPAVVRMSKQYGFAQEIVKNTDWVGACSFGLFNNDLAQSDLQEGVQFISETGVVALINFQKKGYAYIKI